MFIDVFQGGVKLGVIQPYSGVLSGAANYDYTSASGHPVNGPSQVGREAQIFFYYDTASDKLYFNNIFSVPGSGGDKNGHVVWDFKVSNSTSVPVVVVADDPQPTASMDEVVTAGGTAPDYYFKGNWTWDDYHTDGGVIGDLGGTDWTITINPRLYDYGIDGLVVYDGDGSTVGLNLKTVPLPDQDDLRGQIVFRPSAVPETSAGICFLAFGLLATLKRFWRDS